MFLALLLTWLAMGSGSGPQPIGDPADWIGPNDYPAQELMRGGVGTTEFDLMVDVDGHPVKCVVTQTSRSKALDMAACRGLMRRARFHPARDESGTATPGAWSDSVIWSGASDNAGSYYRDNPADLIVYVQALPGGASRQMFKLRRVQRADGSVETCVVESNSDPAIEAVLCERARSELRATPILDAAGTPVRGVRINEVMAIARSRAS